jgi:hypothetical protein
MLGVHEKVKSTIMDIEDKYKEILLLEKVSTHLKILECGRCSPNV